MPRPLDGLKILDLSWFVSGPFCTMTLCDLGAEVVKLEKPPFGDTTRSNFPTIHGVSHNFISLNRGKKSIVLDLATEKGKTVFLRLVKHFDVLVENFRPGTMEKLGLDYQALKQHNPRLIYASISGFGQSGPYTQWPALDIVAQAMGGIMSITGEPGRPPARVGVSEADIVAGLYTAIAILAALEERRKSGQGQYLDISMLDCQVALIENALMRYFATGEVPGPVGSRSPTATPFQAFPTRDGYVVVAMLGDHGHWELFCAALDRVDLIDHPLYATNELRCQNYEQFEPLISSITRTRTTEEWLKEFRKAKIPCGPVNAVDVVASDPQVAHRQMLVDMDLPGLGQTKVVNSPIKMSRTPAKIAGPPPVLGQDTSEVLRNLLGMTDAEIDEVAVVKASALSDGRDTQQ